MNDSPGDDLLDPISLRAEPPVRAARTYGIRSFGLAVVMPTLIVFLYLSFIAPPRYAVRIGYIVTNGSAGAVDDPVSGPGSVLASRQAGAMVRDYIVSQQAVSDLSSKLKLTTLFKPPGFDPVFKFWWDDGSIEALARYWRNWVIEANFDKETGIGSLEFTAFTPQDALRIGQASLELAGNVINDLGQHGKDVAATAAQDQVDRADLRLQSALKRLAEFHQAQRAYQTGHAVEATGEVAASLRQSLAVMNAQLNLLSKTLSPTAPAIVNIKSQMTATEEELQRVVTALDDGASLEPQANAADAAAAPRLPSQTSTIEYLEAERNFAVALKTDALRLQERAKFAARFPNMSMHAFVRPQLPKAATYPMPLFWSAATFAGFGLCWIVASWLLIARRVRPSEHSMTFIPADIGESR